VVFCAISMIQVSGFSVFARVSATVTDQRNHTKQREICRWICVISWIAFLACGSSALYATQRHRNAEIA